MMAQIGNGATVKKSTGIGQGATVNNNSGIGQGATVNNNSQIGQGATPQNNGQIGQGATPNNSQIGNGATPQNNQGTGRRGLYDSLFGGNSNNNNNGRNTGYNNNGNQNQRGNGRPRRPKPRPGIFSQPESERPLRIDQLKVGNTTAQRATVYVDIYAYGNFNNELYPWATALHNDVVNGLIETGRVNVVDLAGDNSYDVYNGERDRDGSILRARRQRMRTAGGTYALEIQLNGLNIYPERNHRDPSRVVWTAEMDYHMRLVDLSSGEVIDRKDYNPTQDYTQMSGRTEAMEVMDARVASQAKYMTLNDFHISGTVIQITNLKNNQAKEVAISVGPAEGAVRGTKFNVYKASYVGGQLVRDKIGKLKVHAIKGDHLTYAKVTNGGEDIYEFYHMQEPGQLYIETGEPGLFDY
jgi:hypothetical protein